MNFIPDPCKQDQELLFSQKRSSKSHRSLNFKKVQLQKHLGLFSYPKFSFDEHIR